MPEQDFPFGQFGAFGRAASVYKTLLVLLFSYIYLGYDSSLPCSSSSCLQSAHGRPVPPSPSPSPAPSTTPRRFSASTITVPCCRRASSASSTPSSDPPIRATRPGYRVTRHSTCPPTPASSCGMKNAPYLPIMGANPAVEYHFTVDNVPQEGPDYEPDLNLIFFSRLRSHPSAQYVIDLNHEPPSLHQRTADPPLVVPCGSTYHQGLIYWCGSATRNGIYVPGGVCAECDDGQGEAGVEQLTMLGPGIRGRDGTGS